MRKPPLHLLLIANLPQPVTLPRRQRRINLHAHKMQEQRHPHRHTEAQTQTRTDLLRLVSELGLYDDEGISRCARYPAGGIQRVGFAGRFDEGVYLPARHVDGVLAQLTRDHRR